MNNTSSKYATLDDIDAKGFREIAEALAKDGHKLTPARVRIIMLKSLSKVIRKSGALGDRRITKEELEQIVARPDFQNKIAPILHMAYDS